jgi:taurine dioxygenase
MDAPGTLRKPPRATSALQVVPGSAPLGAEVRGADIGAGVAEATIARVRDALHEHKVVVLRNQKITPEQQIAFSSHFGRLEPHVLPQFLLPGYKALVRVSNVLDEAGQPIGLVDAGRIWHTDGHFLEKPNMYSMLYAIEVPHGDDGEPLGATKFANTAYAYAHLPETAKQRLQGLRGVNSLAAVYASMHGANAGKNRPPLTEAQKREVEHPVVRTHPVTGEKCIYVSKAATMRIVGLPKEESDALIDELSAWCVRDEVTYVHRWQVGDLLLWDNCASQHLAVGDYALPRRRLMHRTTVSGMATF